MVREYIEIEAVASLEALIERLTEVKMSIPPDAKPEQVSLRGDDNFGRHILVTYLRPERPEELAAPIRAREFATAWRRQSGSIPALPHRRTIKVPANRDSLSALRLKRRELEERIEELESGSARVEELGPDGFRDVTAVTLVELHTELGRVGASIHRLLARLRKHPECTA